MNQTAPPAPSPVRRSALLMPNLLMGFATALLVIAAAGWVTYRAAQQFAESSRQVLHTQQVLETLSTLEVAYAETVSAVRGYVITGAARYLAQYRESQVELGAQFSSLRLLTTDNASQQQVLDRLDTDLQRREAVLARAVNARETGGIEAVVRITAEPNISEPEEAVRTLLEQVREQENSLLAQRSALDDERIAGLRLTLLLFFFCTLVILVVLFLRARANLLRREAAQQEIDWQRRFSDTIIEAAPMGIYLKDARTLKMVRANRFVEELTGVSRETMINADSNVFFPSSIAERSLAEERQLLAGGETMGLEQFTMDTHRGPRVMLVKKVPILGADGTPAFLLGISEDITERLHAEERQREFSERLELNGRQLEQANKELESFSYSVSHDLRAPLRAVDGYAGILEEDYGDRLDAEGQRYLAAIRQGAAKMGTLIQDLLTFSRLGRQTITATAVNTRAVVDAALQGLAQANGGELKTQIVVGELPASYADPRLLEHVWTNLLDNAIKYSHKSADPRVDVQGEVVGNETVFAVRDNGIGFDMRYYDKLFNVFQRLHNESDYTGTGVGLAIIQRIVSRHGGRVWAEATVGEGACFSFALPISNRPPRQEMPE